MAEEWFKTFEKGPLSPSPYFAALFERFRSLGAAASIYCNKITNVAQVGKVERLQRPHWAYSWHKSWAWHNLFCPRLALMSDLFTDRVDDVDQTISGVIAKHTSDITDKWKCEKGAVGCWRSQSGSEMLVYFRTQAAPKVRQGKAVLRSEKWPNKRCKQQIFGPFLPCVCTPKHCLYWL